MLAITRELLDTLTAQAQASPRLRKNHNLHQADDSPCHRLLNAMEPDSYIQPHRHLAPDKDESIVVLRGRLAAIAFDDEGTVTATHLLEPGGAALAIDVPHGLFHTFVCLERGSVFFEAKAGPYLPLTPAERAPWAPAEGEPEAPAYLAALKARLQSP